MRVTFESGAWVELRTPQELNAKDKSAMLKATVINVDWTTQRAAPMSLDAMSQRQYAIMERVITAWSYEYMLPKDDPSEDEDGIKTYEASLMVLPIDDWNELEEAIEPHSEKLNSGPKGTRTTTSRSNGSSKARATASRKV